jgi:hypothetical protein
MLQFRALRLKLLRWSAKELQVHLGAMDWRTASMKLPQKGQQAQLLITGGAGSITLGHTRLGQTWELHCTELLAMHLTSRIASWVGLGLRPLALYEILREIIRQKLRAKELNLRSEIFAVLWECLVFWTIGVNGSGVVRRYRIFCIYFGFSVSILQFSYEIQIF